MLLVAGNLPVLGWEVAGFRLLPIIPILPLTRVIGRSLAFYQDMPADWKPTELQQVTTCGFVTKHPVVLPVGVQPAEVSVSPPLGRFVRVSVPGIPIFPMEHPVVKH